MKSLESDLNTRPVKGVFAGNALSFSDTALRLIEAELPCLSCVRTAAVNDLLLMGPARANVVRLIVVDESMLDDLTKVMPQIRATFPMASIILAFRQISIAHTLMGRLQSNPSWGQVGFLPMNINLDSWLSVVRLLASGENYVPSEFFVQTPPPGNDVTPDRAQSNGTKHVPETVESLDNVHLTARELQVLEAAAKDKQNKIIADELKLSQHTVKLHMHHIIAKLGVHNRTEAANWFHGRSA